jgi:SnoaL-like domain
MGKFSRAELEGALAEYNKVADRCTETGDWSPFADQFTEDCVYEEHGYGTFHGREAVRTWIVDVMAPFPHMRFAHLWDAYDDENDAVVFGIRNILDHPTDADTVFEFPNFSRIVYAGDGLWSSEEDVYNPARDAPDAIKGWLAAGGKFESAPKIELQHG